MGERASVLASLANITTAVRATGREGRKKEKEGRSQVKQNRGPAKATREFTGEC